MPSLSTLPNASLQLLPTAGATQERRLEAVSWKALLGPARERTLFLHPAPDRWFPPALGSLPRHIPSNVDGLLGMETPDRKINVRDPHHCPHAFRDRIELPMPEQATYKGRHFVLGHSR